MEDARITDIELLKEMQRPGTGVDHADKSFFFRKTKAVFSGSDAVSWIKKRLECDDEKATETFERLLKIQLLDISLRFSTMSSSSTLSGPSSSSSSSSSSSEPPSGPIQLAIEKMDRGQFRFTRKKRLVVVGGGFAGAMTARLVQHDLEVFLIDKRGFVELTPSVPFVLGDDARAPKISLSYKSFIKTPDSVILNDKVARLTDAFTLETEGGMVIEFDFLLLATGSFYKPFFEGPDVVYATSADQMLIANQRLADPSVTEIVIIGGGSVALEVAGQIAVLFPQKRMTIVAAREKLMERTSTTVHDSVIRWFSKHSPSTRFMLGERVASYNVDEKTVLLSTSQETLPCHLLFPCMGFSPSTDFLSRSDFFSSALEPSGLVKVLPTLQVEGFPHIFAAGDITNVAEEKLAQNAMNHTAVVSKNLCHLASVSNVSSDRLRTYSPSERIMVISLGPRFALMIRGDWIVMEGAVPMKLKSATEAIMARSVGGWF